MDTVKQKLKNRRLFLKRDAKLAKRLKEDYIDNGILIHGQCMCGSDYEKVIEELSENYTICLIDCFGHGESEKAPELYCQKLFPTLKRWKR